MNVYKSVVILGKIVVFYELLILNIWFIFFINVCIWMKWFGWFFNDIMCVLIG